MNRTQMIEQANRARARGVPDRRLEQSLEDVGRRLVVYGSMAPGGDNGHILAPLGGYWTECTLEGQLVPEGWGGEADPGLALDTRTARIPAHCITSIALPEVYDALDHFAGEEFVRLILPFETREGRRGTANVYVLAHRTGLRD